MSRRAAALAVLLVASCGYHSGMVLPESSGSVAVEFFGNDSVVRDLEADLHRHLTNSYNRMVPAPLVAPDRADLVLRGRIVSYTRRGGIRSPDNELLETGIRIVVEARLVERVPEPDGGVREEERGRGTYATDSGYRTEEVQGEIRARERALRNLSDRIVLDLFGALSYEVGP